MSVCIPRYLNEVALFFECYLQRGKDYPGTPAGSYSSVNDCFSELCGSDPNIINVNPHITISLLRFLLPVFVDAATALDIVPQRRELWRHLHANLAPLPLVDDGNGTIIFGGVLGSPGPPKTGGNPLNAYLSWPGYDDALTTDAGLAKIRTNTLDYMAATGSASGEKGKPPWSCGNW
eukprot:SAG22_NODE_100_length_20558_cov_10.189305_10_plen_177_part_00